jgi:hypothetical protein
MIAYVLRGEKPTVAMLHAYNPPRTHGTLNRSRDAQLPQHGY